eukprot:1157913-Pelagomonas_calceolata.AAC.2
MDKLASGGAHDVAAQDLIGLSIGNKLDLHSMSIDAGVQMPAFRSRYPHKKLNSTRINEMSGLKVKSPNAEGH